MKTEICHFLATAALIAAAAPALSDDQPDEAWMTFTRTGGFAGEQLEIVIRSDGAYTVAHKLGPSNTKRTDKLDKPEIDNLRAIAKEFAEHTASKADHLGSDIRVMSLTVEKRSATWTDLSKNVPESVTRLAAAVETATSPKLEKIEVKVVKLEVQKKNPPNLVIDVDGEAPSGGWTHVQLVKYVYVTPPADGIWEFDLVALAPTGPAPQVITPVKTQYVWESFPQAQVKGVRVYGRNTKVETKLP